MSLVFIGEQFRNEVTRPFSLRRLERGRQPIDFGKASLAVEPGVSTNNLLIKLRNSNELKIPAFLGEPVRAFIEACVAHARAADLPVRNRFIYVTLDSRPFKKGGTQRTPGWHAEGLQGAEVPVKQGGCYHFLWTNKLPFKISTQGFDLSGINLSQHHVFDSLARQVYDDMVKPTLAGHLYLLNCYQMYTAVPADQDTDDRLFVRVSFSELAYTSTRMSLNPDIDYPFTPHTTTGAAPAHLQVWDAGDEQVGKAS
ncbi:hypothetical protein DV532_26675 (plasmid) [Pseudomonas sp. Leaf58]|uniref:hypothetical protein n=1 Tax=Pseudomonas sp. Leaf58 TaxID=1736226 RepID=UPI0006FC23B8|nr:hypothetical protein [Pseudomonas sp. Leaf58]AYG47872.1 hypothetical protein DV532_26675 [Pseudomonas sp. Leaf58]KQN62565.1 hypothetical protein ASF02_10485 [Pseudomonas sp. Leaf58]